MTCNNPTDHQQDWETIDRRKDARRIWCPLCNDDWWTDEEEDDQPTPPPARRPRAVSQQFIDLYTDGAGHCFSDADPGL
jgi:hypothetical protein